MVGTRGCLSKCKDAENPCRDGDQDSGVPVAFLAECTPKEDTMRRLIACVVLISLTSAAAVLAEDPVYFPDANLKAAVEQALGKTDPTPTDMLTLTFPVDSPRRYH